MHRHNILTLMTLTGLMVVLAGCTKNYTTSTAYEAPAPTYAVSTPTYIADSQQSAVASVDSGVKVSSYTSKARLKSTMRSYRVGWRSYQPYPVSIGETMYGKSSWYGPNFHGKQTSSGEQYNMHAYTAAHKTWPMDTMVRVDNLTNGKSVVVRINDRGPFVQGRVIDCSYQAGKSIGLDKSGIANVRLTVVGFAGKVAAK